MEKQNPIVSIIMPAYNQARYVEEAIQSVLSQTYNNWELIIVDDGSPDNVKEVASKYTDSETRIKFYHTDNHGPSAARNFGVKMSSGEFILPFDADDKIAPEYLEKCIREFREKPSTDLVYCRWQFFGDTRYTPELRYSGYRELLANNSIFCSAMYRRKDFDRVGGYDESIPFGLEDWEFWIRMLDAESEVTQLPDILFFYRRRKVSRSQKADIPDKSKVTMQHIYAHNREKYEANYPDMLSELNELYYLRRRMEKWKHRSLFSRLWYAVRGKI